ncbi:phage tail protein I [Halomonas organivorans]|uniref:Phage tail P2-like protein n=1 Tax=Halomonas organivorans TaxID=257772 RepID=A0A7W5G584_9GAMM|nr:phage tail protein I [Halomonas organivorans]MBB3141213.1 phage tail P2-like protein [Halomonas organivorans]
MTSLLPPNRTALEDRVAASHPLALPVPLRTLWNPHTCPAHLLPFLAWAFSVDHWSPDWPERIKRDVIAASFEVHRIKGTRLAVDRALAAMGIDVEITEWFEAEPMLPRGTFEAVLYVNDNLTPDEPAFLNQRLYDELRATIDAAKNVRSHYAFKVGARFGPNRLGAASALQPGALARQAARPTQPPLEAIGTLTAAAAHQAGGLARRAASPQADTTLPAARIGAAGACQVTAVSRHATASTAVQASLPAASLRVAGSCQAVAITRRHVRGPDAADLPDTVAKASLAPMSLRAAGAWRARGITHFTMESTT